MAIFINYRRKDSEDITGRIYDKLVENFSKDSVFKDVDDIPLGVDFKNYLESKIQESKVFLAVIGNEWLDVQNPDGSRRIDGHQDFVRIEIELALTKNMLIIPVFVQGVKGLSGDKLPESIQELATRNGIEIRSYPDFHVTTNRLIKKLESVLAATKIETKEKITTSEHSRQIISKDIFKKMQEAGYAWLTSISDSLGNINLNSWGKGTNGDWSGGERPTVYVGQKITFIAEGHSPDTSLLEYQFKLQRSGQSLNIQQDWSRLNTWTWHVKHADIGRGTHISIAVRVKKDYYQYRNSDDYTYAIYDVLPEKSLEKTEPEESIKVSSFQSSPFPVKTGIVIENTSSNSSFSNIQVELKELRWLKKDSKGNTIQTIIEGVFPDNYLFTEWAYNNKFSISPGAKDVVCFGETQNNNLVLLLKRAQEYENNLFYKNVAESFFELTFEIRGNHNSTHYVQQYKTIVEYKTTKIASDESGEVVDVISTIRMKSLSLNSAPSVLSDISPKF